MVFLEGAWGIHSERLRFHRHFTNSCKSHDLIFSEGVVSSFSSRAWTLASNRLSLCSSHSSWGVNRFFKESIGWCAWFIPIQEGSHNVPECLRHDLAVTYSNFPSFKCLIVGYSVNCLGDPITAILHAWSLVSRHNFLSLCLSCRRRSSSGSSLFISERVILLVNSL